MAYIGRDTDKISNIEKLDVITFDGSQSYTLQKNSVDFVANSANSLQISIDGVVQAGNFTVSGSTIDFGVAIPSTSTCDFIFHYGTGLVTTVSDGAITTAKLGDASVTSAKLSGVTQGITGADQFILTADITADQDPISSNLSRQDGTGFGKVGTGMTQSSGVFTFPETGIWSIKVNFTGEAIANDNVILYTKVTTDNSTYNEVVYGASSGDGSATGFMTGATEYLFDVTDTSTHKVSFKAQSIASGSKIKGQLSGLTYTSFTFIRLGDT